MHRNIVFKPYVLFLVFAITVAVAAPAFSPHDPYATNVSVRLESPSLRYLFGTDELGRCVLSRVVYGARISMGMGMAILLTSMLIGGSLGMLAGYFGGRIDEAIMRLTDIFMAIPSMVVALVLAGALGPGIEHMILIISITMWPGYARMIRGLVLDVKNEHYVEVAIMTGLKNNYILLKHILPGILPPILVMATLGMGRNILMTSSLSFLGLGIVEPTPDWGAMLNKGMTYIRTAPHIALYPGIVISLMVLSFNMLGDALGHTSRRRK
jgi:peptide/nickel transport system permease protein